jgi:predicted MFS family arabinose efflux permease
MGLAVRIPHRVIFGVLNQADFLKLWLGLTGSLFGMQVSGLALPLTAVLSLGASASEMGVLSAARWLPYLLVGLFAGVWLDRVRRRPVLIVTHLGRAGLLASIPVASVLGVLHIEQLYVVSFAIGGLMIFSDAAYQSFLPSLVAHDDLVDGNSKFELSRSLATIVGPGIGGWLVQVLSAPVAIAADSISFVVDALLVGQIRTAEPQPGDSRTNRNVWREVGEGLRWVFGNPYLRPIQATSMSFICANAVWSTVYILFLTRELGIEPTLLGLIFAAGGPGALVGSVIAGAAARRLGLGSQIVYSQILAGMAIMIIPLAAWQRAAAVPLLLIGSFLAGLTITLGSIGELSLRQGITPPHLLGRTNATMRSLNWGTVTAGSVIGGFLGDSIGLAPTLLVGAVGSLLSVLWLVFSPVRHVHDVQDQGVSL